MGRLKRPTSANFAQWLKLRERRIFSGHLDAALKAPELASHLGSKERARSWVLRAIACRRKRRLEDAVDAWSIAFSLSLPDDSDSWILSRFAVWQLDQGQLAEGLTTAIRSVELAAGEDRAEARYARGQALWRCGHSQEALSDFVAAANQAPLNSPAQLCALASVAIVLANSPDMSPKSAALVLKLASDLRSALENRKLPRLRGFLRWATGLAQAACGRKHAGARDLLRARQTFRDLGDAAVAAVITLDYAAMTGRPQEPLLSEILDEAPVDTATEILTILAAMASGRSDGSQRQHLTSLAVSSTVGSAGEWLGGATGKARQVRIGADQGARS